VTLITFANEHHAVVCCGVGRPAAINVSCLPGPQQQTYHMLLQWSVDGTDRWTLYRYTDPAAYYADSVNNKEIQGK